MDFDFGEDFSSDLSQEAKTPKSRSPVIDVLMGAAVEVKGLSPVSQVLSAHPSSHFAKDLR